MINGKEVVDREQWLAERQNGIGASEAAACLGIRPSPLEVYCRKIGIPVRDVDTIPKRVGRALEGTIAELYQEETGVEIVRVQVMLWSKEYPWMFATLDGVTGSGIVEFKTISVRRANELGLAEDEDVPYEWLAQVHHQMIVTGEEKCDIAVLLGNEEFRNYTIRRNEDLCRALIERERDVWQAIESRTPPDPGVFDDYKTILRAHDRYEGAIQASPDLERVAQAAHDLGQLITQAEKARDTYRAQVAAYLGNASCAVGPAGWIVERKLISRAGYTVAPTAYPKLTIKAPKGLKHEQSADPAAALKLAGTAFERLRGDRPELATEDRRDAPFDVS